MTDADLRALQDEWLTLPSVVWQLQCGSEYERITGATGAPTFHDVKTLLLPEWEGFFRDFF